MFALSAERMPETVDTEGLELEGRSAFRRRGKGVGRGKRKVESHAAYSSSGSSGRGRCSFVVGQSLHPNAVNHQVNFEWHRGHCGRFVAAECLWAVSLPFRYSCRKRMMCGESTGSRLLDPVVLVGIQFFLGKAYLS